MFFISSLTPQINVKAKINLICLGPLPPPYSGTTVSYAQLQSDMQEFDGFNLIAELNTQADKKSSQVVKGMYSFALLFKVILKISKTDLVFINGSRSRVLFLGLILWPFSLLFKKPLVLRFFGGALDEYYSRSNFFIKKLLSFVLQKSAVLLQTERSINFFKNLNQELSIFHFPTSRNSKNFKTINLDLNPSKRIKIICLSEVRRAKGIFDLIEAANFLANNNLNYEISIFGHAMEEFSAIKKDQYLDDHRYVKYCGVIRPDQLPAVLNESHVLILPTIYSNEGYPGAIIEAFHAGLPVIATRCGCIPEILDDSCSILVSQSDKIALAGAIQGLVLDQELRKKLSLGSKSRAQKFDSEYWNKSGLHAIFNKILSESYD